MSVTERERLAPSTFRLPVEKIRDGYYSDAYFNYTKELLEHEGDDARGQGDAPDKRRAGQGNPPV